MPSFEFTSPEGKKYTVAGPDGATKEQAFQMLQTQLGGASPKTAEPSMMDGIKQGAGNLAAGLVRGAGSIGATILAPVDIAKDALAGKGLSLESNRQRRADMDAGLQSLGAEPDSLLYKTGKLGGEVAGTAGMGGLLANGARAVGAGNALTNAIATGGFKAGTTPGVGNLLTRAAGGAVTGGASAGLVNPEDATTGAVVGGALPVVASGVVKAAKGVGNKLRGGEVAPEVKALATRAQELGIDVPADRIVDSKPLNAVASALNYVPFSGRAATETKMQSQLNRALSRTFGQDSDNVTMSLRKAQDALGGEFDKVLQANTVKVDQQFMADLADSASKASRELGSDGSGIIAKQVEDILAKAGSGEIDGQAAYNIKKTLDRIGRRNTPEAYYATDLKKSLMAALDRSLGPDEAASFAKTRQQYGNMLSLEKLAKNGADGDVSIARIANMKNINNKDLQELADISAQFLKAREGQHGAMQRAVAGMATASMGGPMALAGGAAAGRGVNMLLNSGMAKNAVLGNTNPAVENALSKLLPATYRTVPVISAR